jgi:hypothetical protein
MEIMGSDFCAIEELFSGELCSFSKPESLNELKLLETFIEL